VESLKRPVGLGLVLFSLAITLSISTAWKGYCANGDWRDGRQYHALCYSDIVPLFGAEELSKGRLPYLESCAPDNTWQCDEYPVLSMYFMRTAAIVAGASLGTFFYANAVMLTLCAGAIVLCLYLLTGRRALWFALSPTLFVYAFVNWDLFAVALATAALLAFLNRRDVWAGVFVGLGVAAKLYPVLFLVPFIADRLRAREPDRAIKLGWAAVGSWAAVNVPFIVRAPGAWSTFFRFNAKRVADFDSLWYIGCRDVAHHPLFCPWSVGLINALSAAAAVAIALVMWWAKARRSPDFPRWTLVFPFVVVFLLTNKVYSPQYGLWLIPLFLLALPDLGWFIAYSIADVAVFLTRFWFFGGFPQYHMWGVPEWAFETAVLTRDAALVGCLVAWFLREPEELPAVQDPVGRRPASVALG
jgi:uncharacterized membrane protein